MDKAIFSIIDLDIIVTIILIVILYMYKRKFNMKEKVNKIYAMLVLTVISIIILEVLDKIILVNESNFVIPITKIINVIGFATAPIIPYLWMRYLFEHFKIKVKLGFLKILIILNVLISILSYNYGLIFSVGELNSYERGPVFFIPMGMTYIFFIVNFIIAYKNKNKINKTEYIIMVLFGVIPIISATIQIIFNGVLLIWGSAGILIIAHYIYLQENLLRYDSLTGIWNRMTFECYFNNNYINKNREFALIYADINDFKEINDNYGHNEGDVALVNVANILRKSFKQGGQAARIGGDEFIIIADVSSEIELKEKIENVHFELDRLNKKNVGKYSLKVSLGYKRFNNNYFSLNEYIKEIDTLMYLDKKNKNTNSFY